jgi:WD40 repeat protein
VVTAGSRRAIVWDPRNGAVAHYLSGGHTAPLTDAAFSPDGRWIATGSRDGPIRIWDARSGHGLASLPSHASPVDSVAFTPDGREILSTSEEGVVRLNRCIPCLPFTEAQRLVGESVTRTLTNGERNAYPKG